MLTLAFPMKAKLHCTYSPARQGGRPQAWYSESPSPTPASRHPPTGPVSRTSPCQGDWPQVLHHFYNLSLQLSTSSYHDLKAPGQDFDVLARAASSCYSSLSSRAFRVGRHPRPLRSDFYNTCELA